MEKDKKKDFSYNVPLGEIQFLGEQDGISEKELKSRFIEVFIRDKGIQKAYLVRISYKCSDEYLVALCLSISSGSQKTILKKVSKCFTSIFGAEQHLEILFLTSELQSQVDMVCTPFYENDMKPTNKKSNFMKMIVLVSVLMATLVCLLLLVCFW